MANSYPQLDRATLPPLLSTAQVAELLGVSAGTLRQWRHQRRGPAYIKLQGLIRYQTASLLAELASRTIEARAPDDQVRADQITVAIDPSARPDIDAVPVPAASPVKRR